MPQMYRVRKAALDKHIAKHVAHVKAGKKPPGPKGPVSLEEAQYIQSETQRRLAKGPRGPMGPKRLPKSKAPHLGPHGEGPIGLKASRRDAQVGYHNPITAAARGVYGLNKTVYKPVYNAVGGLIHQRNISAQDRADMNASGNAVWQETGVPALRSAARHPGRSIGGDVLAVAGIVPLPFLRGAKGVLRAAKGGERAAEEVAAAKSALIRGPRRTAEEANAHVAERSKHYAAAHDEAVAKGGVGGFDPRVKTLNKGETSAETGGVPGQIVRETFAEDPAALEQLRVEKEKLYAADRSRRNAAMARAAEGKSGMDRHIAVSSTLKGKMPSPEFKGLDSMTEPQRTAALNHIYDNPDLPGYFTKKATADALNAAIEGKVLTPHEQSLLEQVFGKVNQPGGLAADAKRYGWKRVIGDVLAVPRSLRSMGDISAMLRQGLVALMYDPKLWAKQIGPMLKSLGSETHFQADKAFIGEMETHKMAIQAGKVAFTDIGKDAKALTDAARMEEGHMSNIAERIWGIGHLVRASDRAYVGFLNLLRAHLFDHLVRQAAKEGYHLTDDVLHDIGRVVNTMTGRGSMKSLDKYSRAMNDAFFSPRLMMARLNMLNPWWYKSLTPFARKQAAKAMSRLVGTVALVLLAAHEAGAAVEIDPRSADFGKIKIGDMRIDLGGGFLQYLHLAGELTPPFQRKSSTTGEMTSLISGKYGQANLFDAITQFFENKTNPLLNTAIQVTKGNQFGNPLDFSLNPLDTNSVVSNLYEPMSWQDALSTYQQTGNPAAGIGAGLAGGVGMGIQSYPAGKPTKKSPTPARELTHQLNRLGITNPKARATFQRAIHVKAQRDRAKDAARKASPSKKISEAEAYKITMQTLLKNKMMTPAAYRGMVAAIPRMNHHQLVYYEDQAWNELGPGSLLEWFHHQYNVATGQ